MQSGGLVVLGPAVPPAGQLVLGPRVPGDSWSSDTVLNFCFIVSHALHYCNGPTLLSGTIPSHTDYDRFTGLFFLLLHVHGEGGTWV